MITVTLTNPRHLAAVAAMHARNPQLNLADPQAFAQHHIERMADMWAEETGVDHIAVAAFVRRFPGAVMDAIAASDDPVVAQILATIDSVTHVRLGAQTTLDSMAYLVSEGYLTQAQSAAILAY